MPELSWKPGETVAAAYEKLQADFETMLILSMVFASR